MTLPWLRWWDDAGNLLLTGEDGVAKEKQGTDLLAAKLRELGIEPNTLE